MGMYAAGFMGFVTFFMICSKSAKMKQLGKLSVIPAIFNITEPLMFGMPIILNPLFFIPQVFTVDRRLCDVGINHNHFTDFIEPNDKFIALDDTNFC